jgi:hypothetical protein
MKLQKKATLELINKIFICIILISDCVNLSAQNAFELKAQLWTKSSKDSIYIFDGDIIDTVFKDYSSIYYKSKYGDNFRQINNPFPYFINEISKINDTLINPISAKNFENDCISFYIRFNESNFKIIDEIQMNVPYQNSLFDSFNCLVYKNYILNNINSDSININDSFLRQWFFDNIVKLNIKPNILFIWKGFPIVVYAEYQKLEFGEAFKQKLLNIKISTF